MGARRLRISLAGQSFAGLVREERCARCGQRFTSYEEVHRFELACAVETAEAGAMRPDVVLALCRGIAVETTPIARLLGVRRETIYRWQTGRSPIGRAAFLTLVLLARDRLAGRDDTRRLLERL